MFLPRQDVHLFFRLHRSLMFCVNQKLQVIPERPADPLEFSKLPVETRIKVRDALLTRMDLIQSFADESSGDLSWEELQIILSCKQLLTENSSFFASSAITWFSSRPTLPSQMKDNPMLDMFQFNGLFRR